MSDIITNDFVSAFWHWWIVVPTVGGIAACVWLLWKLSHATVMGKDAGAHGATETTGHVWDETLREFNNPMPRWWVGLFIITVVFAAVYFTFFGLASFGGTGGWTARGQYEAEMAAAKAQLDPVYAAFEGKDAEALQKEPKAMAIGERLFLNNCAQCHASDGRGSKGFPNLADKDWLYGGSHETVMASIAKGRNGMMPPMAAAVGGTSDDVYQVAQYVLSLSGSESDPVAANLGKPKFGACAACHGADGKGNQAMGAPNLTDKTWLHGGGVQNVMLAINKGRGGVMPAQEAKLTEAQIRVLAAYVMNLSNAK